MVSFLTGAAANTIGSVVSVVIPPLIGLIDDVIHLDRNSQHLQHKLRRMKLLLQDITRPFQHDQRSPPDTVIEWLQRLQDSLQDAKRVMEHAQQQKGCLDCFLCREKLMPTQVRQWIANFDKLLIDLEREFSILRNAQEMVSSAPPQPEVFLQPVPKLGYVGSGIKSAETQVKTWLDKEDRQFRIIGVHGMGGIGKTSLLKTVYNAYKKGKLFQAVIWTTVSGNYNIVDLQSSIAKEINLKLESSVHAESSSAVDMSKRRLCAGLREMKFLLILDDLWKDLDLEEELGIPLGNDKGGRVLISTRSRDVITRMWADDYSLQIQPLSTDEAWHLFCRGAFRVGTSPTKDIEDVATQIAGECNDLPLAINVVAAAMKGNTTVHHWHLAFNQLRNVDPLFLAESGIAEDLYKQLRLSSDRLPHPDIKNCFLSCAAFPPRLAHSSAVIGGMVDSGRNCK